MGGRQTSERSLVRTSALGLQYVHTASLIAQIRFFLFGCSHYYLLNVVNIRFRVWTGYIPELTCMCQRTIKKMARIRLTEVNTEVTEVSIEGMHVTSLSWLQQNTSKREANGSLQFSEILLCQYVEFFGVKSFPIYCIDNSSWG